MITTFVMIGDRMAATDDYRAGVRKVCGAPMAAVFDVVGGEVSLHGLRDLASEPSVPIDPAHLSARARAAITSFCRRYAELNAPAPLHGGAS